MSSKQQLKSFLNHSKALLIFIKQNLWFAYKHRHIRNKRKIIYAITPPPRLKNVGDHAQAVAIHAWIKKHFPTLRVIDIDKDRARYFLPALRWLVQPADLLFLHSGGNMGDRGMWSESIRRLLISTFNQNKIVSLPQTIYFSDTPIGKKERENTRRIYATHPNLTVIARDPRSGELARELFPSARTFCMPDFVLSLPSRQPGKKNNPPKVLLCLRNDTESSLTAEQKIELAYNLPHESSCYDTTIDKPIKVNEREAVLEHTLDLFQDHDIVVTDRLHGVIFSVLCKMPCVVLPTVDHKLTSAMYWFRNIPFIILAENLKEVPALIEKGLAAQSFEAPDWNAKYFNNIPKIIGTN
jgi:pyruvyl transferase EpsI